MNELSQKNQDKIVELEKGYAIVTTKLDAVTQSINEIKNNHLLHINDELRAMNATIVTNQNSVMELIRQSTASFFKAINDLRINDAKQEPSNKIVTKVIEWVIIAVVGAGFALIVAHSLGDLK